jgi:FAD:protein FMN transferase
VRELTEFTASASQLESSDVDAVSGPTRQAGDYTLQWDGKGLDGAKLSGPFTLWVEAAREHGPHSVVSGPVALGQPGTITIPGSGELSDVVMTVG